MESQVLQRRFAAGQAQADFPQRFHLCHLAKQHGYKLSPAGEPLGVAFGLVRFHCTGKIPT